MSIRVIRQGLLTTIQDMGRSRYQKYGVTVGGAADRNAARIANMLVGNEESEAVLELTLAGAELCFEREQLIAVCGGDMTPKINGKQIPMWRPVLVMEGSILKLASCVSGCRAYVAVAGGIDVPNIMGSRSTYQRASIGGLEGRPLRNGDVVNVGTPHKGSLSERMIVALKAESNGTFVAARWHVGHFANGSDQEVIEIRAMRGAHISRLAGESRKRLFGQTFRISYQSDRMGCRLEGERLQLVVTDELLSEAVTCGTVQLPAGGQPIMLLADRQTTGGYSRIAQVAAVDLSVAAQLKPGDVFRFTEVTQQRSEALMLEAERELKIMAAAIELKYRAAK